MPGHDSAGELLPYDREPLWPAKGEECGDVIKCFTDGQKNARQLSTMTNVKNILVM
jgi:hypothetical protein